jgi:hypothetical protein
MKCGVCGEEAGDGELRELELHDGSTIPAMVWQHGYADDGRPHWKRVEPIKRDLDISVKNGT